MPYDPTAPDSNLTLQASDDILRADKTFLKNGLEREHHFDGVETSGSGDHLVHKMGSARVWIYDNAVELTTGTLASTYSLSKARNTGIQVIDKRVGRCWFCWDGAADGWIELSKLGGALQLAGALTVAGLSTLSGDVQMATTKKLKVIAGESFIQDSAAVSLNPYIHAATRHQITGSEGAWVRALDPLRGLLVGAPKTASSTTQSALTGSFVTKVSTTYNLTGRTQNSRIGLLAICIIILLIGGALTVAEARLTVNGAASALGPIAKIGIHNTAGLLLNTGFLFDLFDVAPTTNFTYALQVRDPNASGLMGFDSGYLLLVDFGEVS